MAAGTTLLDVTEDATGTEHKVSGPCTIFAEGTFGGGTLTVSAARESGGTFVAIETMTEAGAFNDTILGPHYLKADIAGSTNPDIVVIAR